jgi:hypothetical protein
MVLAKLGHLGDARDLLQMALEADPTDAVASFYLDAVRRQEQDRLRLQQQAAGARPGATTSVAD